MYRFLIQDRKLKPEIFCSFSYVSNIKSSIPDLENLRCKNLIDSCFLAIGKGVFNTIKWYITDANPALSAPDLQCNKINETIDINKTVFKEYEYSKLNNNIKKNLKSINDYVLFKENNEYNYIVLCDLNYDENILKNINFKKNINSLIDKIQKQFLKKYKNEYKFSKIK